MSARRSSSEGSRAHARAITRVFALPAGQRSLMIALGVLAVALFAGTVRVLPLMLAPGVPTRVALPLARGVLGVSLETALFVAPPLGWALVAARLVERGEARALGALGVRPARIVASAWPMAVVMALCAALAAASWGKEAAAPGRLARQLVSDAKAACLRGRPGPGRGRGPDGRDLHGSASQASRRARSDDRRSAGGPRSAPKPWSSPTTCATIRLHALDLVVPTDPSTRLRVGDATIHGLAPLGRASNLGVLARTALMGLSALLMASAAAWAVLAWSLRSRLVGAAVGAAGPVAALLVFSALERAPTRASAYLVIPAVGLAAVMLAARLARAR